MRFLLLSFVVVMLSTLPGCETQQSRTEQEFGNSVRSMVEAQKAPVIQPLSSSGMDGRKTENVLKTYREDVSKPGEIKNEITINVGGN